VRASALLLLAWPALAAAYSPAVEFALNCQGCHRADGAGTPGSVPALADSVARFLAVPGGREYLVQVPGWRRPARRRDPGRRGELDARAVRPSHVPAGFVPYGAEEIGRLRASPLVDVDRVRGRLVEAMRK